MRTQGEASVYKPRREVRRKQPCDTWILHFQPPDCPSSAWGVVWGSSSEEAPTRSRLLFQPTHHSSLPEPLAQGDRTKAKHRESCFSGHLTAEGQAGVGPWAGMHPAGCCGTQGPTWKSDTVSAGQDGAGKADSRCPGPARGKLGSWWGQGLLLGWVTWGRPTRRFCRAVTELSSTTPATEPVSREGWGPWVSLQLTLLLETREAR